MICPLCHFQPPESREKSAEGGRDGEGGARVLQQQRLRDRAVKYCEETKVRSIVSHVSSTFHQTDFHDYLFNVTLMPRPKESGNEYIFPVFMQDKVTRVFSYC